MDFTTAALPDTATLIIIAATFLLAGTVKGVIGLGLPTISLALLTVTLDLQKAMALDAGAVVRHEPLAGHGRRAWPCDPAAAVAVPFDGDGDDLARCPGADTR